MNTDLTVTRTTSEGIYYLMELEHGPFGVSVVRYICQVEDRDH